MDSNKRNAYCTDQQFYIVLTLEEGYGSQLSVTNECIGLISIVDVDYGNLPIKCKFCVAITHLVRNYPTISSNKKEEKT